MQRIPAETQSMTALKIWLISLLIMLPLIVVVLAENEFSPTHSITGVIVEKAERKVFTPAAIGGDGENTLAVGHTRDPFVYRLTYFSGMVVLTHVYCPVCQSWSSLAIGQHVSIEYRIGPFSGTVKIRRIRNA